MTTRPTIRVLAVIPGDAKGATMIFARRQQEVVFKEPGIIGDVFFLKSRTNILEMYRELRRLRDAIEVFRPDLIHAQYGTATSLFCAMSGLPLVITYRGSDLNPVPSMKRRTQIARHLLSQFSALFARSIICVSEELKNRLWWREDRASVIPSGVDLDVFHPQDRQTAREKLGWDNGETVVLFNASRVPAVKRLDMATEAVDLARKALQNIRFVVLRGDSDPLLVPWMLNASDCLLMTSDHEGSPNIVKEAIACGLPVISVEVGDVAERLEHVAPSWIVPRDAMQIAAAIIDISGSRPRSNGPEIAKETLSIRSTGKDIVSVYSAIVNDFRDEA